SLPCDPVPGDYRMRVRDVFNQAGNTMDPCASYDYGETEDYTITIAPPPPCPIPSAGIVLNYTDVEATLDWLTGCEEELWDLHVGLAGLGAPEGAPSDPSITKPFTKTGLESNTVYEFWIRANCEENGVSFWVGPFTFTTFDTCVTPDVPTNLIFSSVASTTTTIGYTAPENAPTGYIIIRSTSNIPPVLENGVVYSTNNTTANVSLSEENDYFVVYNSTGLSTSLTSGLSANTQYYYYVYSRFGTNTTSCYGGPVYSTMSLTGTMATSSAAPSGLAVNDITFDKASLTWTTPAVGGNAGEYTYLIEVAIDSGFTSQIVGSPFTSATNSYNLTDLEQGTTYFVRVRTNNGFSYSPYSTSTAFATLIPGQVGLGATTTSGNFPVSSGTAFSYSQQIYTKAEVEANLEEGQNFITKIKFFYNGN